MSRDMNKILGSDCPKKQRAGGCGRDGGPIYRKLVSDIQVSTDAYLNLAPNHKPLLLPQIVEKIIENLRDFESRFGTDIVTRTLL